LSLACSPAAPAAPTQNADPFAVVRATSEAAYQAGQAELSRGDYLQACVDLDKAKTNDPDSRADIQQALDQATGHGCAPITPVSQATSPPAAAQQRTLVVATISAGLGTALVGPAVPSGAVSTLAAATPQSGLATPAAPGGGQTPGASIAQTPAPGNSTAGVTAATARPLTAVAVATSVSGTVAAGTSVAGTAAPAAATAPPSASTASASTATPLMTWRDAQGRFSLGVPPGWSRVDNPQSLVGTGAVEFHDPSGRAEIDVAVDPTAHAVSPELYAASLELAMQRQVPGYASEQIVPATIAGNPSVQRVYTFTQRDPSGQDHQARGFQTVFVKGSTPYVISGSAPAEEFQQFGPTFDQIVQSFQFS
jgi:hypothetical protein